MLQGLRIIEAATIGINYWQHVWQEIKPTKIFSKRFLKDWGKQALDFWLSFFQEAFF